MSIYRRGRKRRGRKRRAHKRQCRSVELRLHPAAHRFLYPRVARAVARWLDQQPGAPERGIVHVYLEE